MSPNILPLSDETLDAVTDIWTSGWHAGHDTIVPAALKAHRTRQSFRVRLVKHRAKTWVMQDQNTPTGFYLLEGNELSQFYIAPDRIGTGLAKPLIANAETRLAQSGHQTAWLACTCGNTRAARFYEKSGWTRTATETYNAETFPLQIWRYEKQLPAFT